MVHAGYTASENRRRKAADREHQRIASEGAAAVVYQDIAAGDYIVFWEEVFEEADLHNSNRRSAYGGLTAAELQCPVVLGIATEDCRGSSPTVKVHRHRQLQGNLNNAFQPGILRNNSKWVVEVCREAVVMVRPEMLKKPIRIAAQSKKQLCEISPISGMYHYVGGRRGGGLVRIGV